ncbi:MULTISPECIES: dihydroneopterin aldolase [Porphyromonadaceae]|uniref:7,8-dihydroneopterin aldolase n=1 Tax=Sanguibacteroides justesenii TaxID=1547597 RepID=A0A0C3RB81_9PORP|nr:MULTISPECIES: dihydroneopterin aldolase [Porphyromonadaceae]KIO42926.1 diguanylate cyclase [Sanguibacteroides justesenii]KIO46184.1 diguanylate cyclase [Sanguibacteroides justesenii]MCR9010827.1 dihydroneopterin aldolase [Gabonibacter chumensis]PXZ44247.1 dihydroneopterin aldolase [Sanguibacteroides justesenii]
MEGIIEIEGMEFFAYHGCYETERSVGNKFRVYAKIIADCGKAAASDDINDALNYFSAYEIIAREMMIPSHLLEHVAKRIIDALYLAFPEIQNVTIKVSKLNPPLGGKIAATSVTLSK